MAPSHAPGGAGGGSIRAIGVPKRVTRTGWRVFATRSRTAGQVALNLDMRISCIGGAYHGRGPQSNRTQGDRIREPLEDGIDGRRLRSSPLEGGRTGGGLTALRSPGKGGLGPLRPSAATR